MDNTLENFKCQLEVSPLHITPEIYKNQHLQIKSEPLDESDSIEFEEGYDIKPSTSDLEKYSAQIKEEEQDSDEESDISSIDDVTDNDNEIEIETGEKDVTKDLIEAVRNRPLLYDDDLQSEGTRDKEAKWEEVSKEVKQPVEVCKSTWESLTTRYTLIVEKEILRGVTRCQWKYKDDMLFFMPFCEKDGSKIINDPNEQFKRKLITTVRDKYPELYDRTHPEFTRYSRVRILTWYKVAEDMDCSADKCRKIWNDLRFVFSSQWHARNNGKKCRRTRFETLLSFLIPFTGASTTERSKPPEEIEDEEFKKKLVKIVQEYPPIYNQPNLRRTDRFIIWKEIAHKTGEDTKKCRETWTYLRHHYWGVIRKRKLGLSVSWKFEKDLEFLFPHLMENSLRHKKQLSERKQPEHSNFRFKLIKIIQKNPLLYDFGSYGYHKPKHDQTWGEIAEELGTSSSVCRNTWRVLKKGFRKQLVKKMKGGTTVKTWQYDDAMQFMRPFMKASKNLSKTSSKEQDTNCNISKELKAEIEQGNDLEDVEFAQNKSENKNTEECIEFIDTDSCLQNEKLIKSFLQTLQKYPQLYSHYTEYHLLPKEEYELTWREVAKEVNWTAADCVKAWRRLKQIYRQRDLKRRKTMGKWVYEDDLEFAKSFILSKAYPKQKSHDEDERCRSPDFRRKLIETAKKYPAVYDPSNGDYHKTQYVRKVVWAQIATEVNHSVRGCYGLWNYLVLTYRESLLSKAIGQIIPGSENFQYSEEMEFLKRYIEADSADSETVNVKYEEIEDNHLNENELFKKKLIQTVRKYPAVYDCGHKGYRRASGKALWTNIAEEMNSTNAKCRDVWASVRANYKYVLKRRKSENYRRTKFEDEMEFIQPFLIKKLDKNKQKEANKEPEDERNDYRFKLIEAIKEYPQLYDPKYMTAECGGNWQQRRIIWNKIAKELGRDVDACRDDWKHLKRNLKNIYTKRHNKAAIWKFTNQMKFMLPFTEGVEVAKIEDTVIVVDDDNDNLNEVDLFRQRLIGIIRKYPIIYDEKLKEQSHTKHTWDTIAEEMNSTAKECRTHWWRLKAFYRDFLQRKIQKTEATWKLQNDMEFMMPQIMNKIDKTVEDASATHESDEFKKRLIVMVRKYPELYDYEHEKFGRRMLTKTTWEDVSQELNRSVLDCRLTWNALKYQYKRLLKGETYTRQKWKFQDDMEFMVPYMFTTNFDKEYMKTKEDKGKHHFTERLIDIIKTKHTKVYMNPNDLDDNTWEIIGNELDSTAHECKELWETLKQTYSILLQGRNSGYDVGVKWKYENTMKFLCSFLPQTESNIMENEELSTIPEIALKTVNTQKRKSSDSDEKHISADESSPSQEKKQKVDYEKAMVASTNIDVKFIKFARSVEKLPKIYQDNLKHKIYNAVFRAKRNFNKNFWKAKRKEINKKNGSVGISKKKISKKTFSRDLDPEYAKPKLRSIDEIRPETENIRRSLRIKP